MSTDADAVALLAVLNAVLPAGRKAYDGDDLANMALKPACYVELVTSRRFIQPARMFPTASVIGTRATLRWVADTVGNARKLRDLCTTALEGQVLLSGTTTPVQFETEEPIGPDDGFYSGSADWTYTT